jgi:hypothetical protein
MLYTPFYRRINRSLIESVGVALIKVIAQERDTFLKD